MIFQVLKFGRPAHREYESLVQTFRTRASAFSPCEALEEKARPNDKTPWTKKLKANPGSIIVCCDATGRQVSTEDFSNLIAGWRDDPGLKKVTFVVGGPYGLDPDLLKSADVVVGFGRTTLPSDLAWLVTWEQLYRALSLLHGSPYHH